METIIREEYFPVVLFIILYKALLTFQSVNVTIQMKANEQYCPAVLFIMLYNVDHHPSDKYFTVVQTFIIGCARWFITSHEINYFAFSHR